MKEFENNAYFWQKVDATYLSGDFKLIYKKGSEHPKQAGLIFPADYGHIKALDSDDEVMIKVFKGSGSKRVESIVVCANILDKELNVIGLVGLSEAEEEDVLHFLNQNDFQKSIIIRRGKDIPAWAVVE